MLKIAALILIALLIFGGFSYFFFFKSATPKSDQKMSGKIVMTKTYWPGSFWIEVAEEKGWFKEEGLDIELYDANIDYLGSVKDLVEGKINVHNLPFFEVMKSNADGANLAVFLSTDTSLGGDALVVKPGINTINDLKGKRVGLSKGSYQEYMLEEVLKLNGLNYEDVEVVDIQVEKVPETFSELNLDGALVYVPFISALQEKINGVSIYDSSQTPGIMSGVMVADEEFIKTRIDDIQKITKVWQRATKFVLEEPDESYAIVSKRYNVPVDEIKEFVKVDKIHNLEDNNTAFSSVGGFESLYGSAKKINDFLIKHGHLTKPLSASDLIQSHFVKQLSSD